MQRRLSQNDVGRLRELFKNLKGKPEFPPGIHRLVELIDEGEASAADLERIVVSLPSLATGLLRVANAIIGPFEPITTVRGSIIRLGQRSVRSLALSLLIQAGFEKLRPTVLDPDRFVRHSLAVAYLSKYLATRAVRTQSEPSRWSPNELFAAGLLHDVGLMLLDAGAPDIYARVNLFASKCQISLERSFREIYRQDLRDLVADALAEWPMPSLFVESMRTLNNPSKGHPEFDCLCSLNYADNFCNASGMSIESWSIEHEVDIAVESEISISSQESKIVLGFVSDQVEGHLAEIKRVA